MKKVRLIILMLILPNMFIGFISCKKDSINGNADVTRISKIKLAWTRKFNDYWVIADINYVNSKISSIDLYQNSRNSNPETLSEYQYSNELFTEYDYGNEQILGKETFAFNGTKIIRWLNEYNINDQFVPLEEIQYEYENANLISFSHHIGETLIPYKLHILSYEDTKIKNLKAFYTMDGKTDLDYECIYTYQDTNLSYIDRKNYLPVGNFRYAFGYEGSRITKIIKQFTDNPERDLLNLFEFTYDESGRIRKIKYNSGIEDSENVDSSAQWDFEYENGKSNIELDVHKILWRIMDIDEFFPEKILNDFFSIYPE